MKSYNGFDIQNTGINSISTTNRSFPVDVAMSGLIKRQTYNFFVEGRGGNHPAVVIPSSGIFIASDKTKDLNFNMVFCGNTAECPDDTEGLLNYNDKISNDPVYNSFIVRLEADGESIFSDYNYVECSGCEFGEDTTSIAISPSYDFSELYINDCNHGFFDISNLKKNTKYYYSIEAENSSWPTIVNPSSGSFDIYQNTTFKLPISICSCANTGVCVEGQVDGLLPYNSDLNDYINNTYKISENVPINSLRATNWTLRLKEDMTENSGTVAIANVYTNYRARGPQDYPVITNFSVDQTHRNDGFIKIDFDFENLDVYMDYEVDFDKTEANWYVYSDDINILEISNSDILLSNHSYRNRPNKGNYKKSILLNFLDINSSGNANVDTVDFDPYSTEPRYCTLSSRLYAKSLDSQVILYENSLDVNGQQGPRPQILTLTEDSGLYNNTVTTAIKNLKYEILVSESNWPVIVENITGVLEYDEIAVSNAGFLGDIYNAKINSNIKFCISNNLCPPGTNNLVEATKQLKIGEDRYIEYNIVLSDIDTNNIFYRSDKIKLAESVTASSGPSADISSNINV